MADTADLIISNGRVMSFDDANPAAEAVAITGNQIVAVGTNDAVANLSGPDTRIVDARGGTVLPGFIESHLHLFGGSAELDTLNLTDVEGVDALTGLVRGYADQRRDDKLVYAVCADYGILGAGHQVTRHDLDQVMPERPFAMMAPDHHTVWANTAALDLAGILKGGDAGEGCEIVMAGDGMAAGELRETGAFGPVVAHTALGGRDALGYTSGGEPDPAPTAAERALDRDVLTKGLKHCAACGITSIHNMDGNFYQLELLDELHSTGDLLCRTQIPFHLKNYHPLDRIEQAEEMRRRYASDMLWSDRVKIFMDGVIDSRTAFMLEGYPDTPDSVGDVLFSAEHFNEAAIISDAKGLQISVHAIGDAAVRRTLDGYEAARNANGTRDSRHRVEHIEVLHRDDLHRFAALDVIASMQPLHSPLSGFFEPPPPNTILREDQLELCFAWQTLRESGAKLIFSSDWPVVPLEPMLSIGGAVATKALQGPWGNQRQSLVDTLAAYTRDGAYAEFSEQRKGRLKQGFLADIVVMPVDLETVEPHDLANIAPVMTLCGGRVTHEM
jgi:hypothetical protein